MVARDYNILVQHDREVSKSSPHDGRARRQKFRLKKVLVQNYLPKMNLKFEIPLLSMIQKNV